MAGLCPDDGAYGSYRARSRRRVLRNCLLTPHILGKIATGKLRSIAPNNRIAGEMPVQGSILNPGSVTSTSRAFLVSLISTHPPDGALSRTSLRPRPRSQRSSASIASSYHDQCARARNIFILRCGTKDHVLLVPQSRQRINSGRSPCRRIASENRGA